jgi:hypothetical protein
MTRDRIVLDIVARLRGREDWEIVLAEVHGLLLSECKKAEVNAVLDGIGSTAKFETPKDIDFDQAAADFQKAEATAEVWAMRQTAAMKGG